MDGWIYLLSALSVILISIHMGIGPFSHPSLAPYHERYRRLSSVLLIPILCLSVLMVTIGFCYVLGIFTFIDPVGT